MLNFKSIELRGFKSFADRVEIPFREGITAIIGPNGCGKSNVADAIRWALGEVSMKQLRGKSMQDVIFAGTEKRKSMSYCEVSLVFNNEDKRYFPALPYDEVVITRKYDRSGISEYYLNRNRTLKNTIVDQFRGTGLGKDGYSIIGQGRVQEIISAKPEDRRKIFEEAADISKLRVEKSRSEGDLAKAAANLQNINEVIAEIERQIVPLKRQADAAAKYFAFKEDLKRNEVNLYLYKFEHNQAVKQKIAADIQKAVDALRQKEEEYANCSAEYEKCLRESQQIDIVYADVTAQLTELKVDAEKMKGDEKLVKQRVESLQSDINRAGEDLREIDAQLIACDKSLDRLGEEKEAQLREYIAASKQLDALTEKRDAMKRTLEGKENELARRNDEYLRAMEEYSDLKSNYADYAAEKGMNEERARNLLELVEQKRRSLDDENTSAAIFGSQLESKRERMRECTAEYGEAISDRDEAKSAVKAYDDDIVSLTSKLAQAEGLLKLYQDVKNEYSGYQDAVRRLMQDSKRDASLAAKIMGVIAEVISVPTEYEAAVEYALGGAMQNIVVEDERTAKEIIEYLKQKGYGRVTFRPLTSCRPRPLSAECKGILREPGCLGLASELISYDAKFVPVIDTLLGSTVVVNNMDNAIALYRKYAQAVRIVTLDGEVLARGGEITGGSRRNQTLGILTQGKRIEQAQANRDKIQNNIALLRDRREERVSEGAELDKKIDALSAELTQLRGDISVLDEKTQRALDMSKTLSVEVEQYSSEYERVEAAVKELKQKLDSVDELERVTLEKKEELNLIKESSKEDGSKQKSESEKLEEQVMNLRMDVISRKHKLETCEMEIHRFTMQKESLEDDKINAVAELKKAQDALDEISAAPQKTSFSEEDAKKIVELERVIADFTARKRDLANRVQALDADKNRLFEERNVVNEKKIRLENSLNNVDIEMNSLQAHIVEEYDLTYAGAQELRDPEFDARGANAAIAELRKSIAKLGDVNPLAPEMLKEMEERYAKNISYRDDLQKAHDDVVEILKKLTERMRSEFVNAFDKINENFKEVFTQIFGGGRAELRLDDSESDDVLEQGIEILAQLPGKKLQNLSLFSGGEQSLMAISILFAIIKLRPMPFCVLDEIDAALDDTNANLFAEYLKKFSDETQFIVITHRKPTMSHADTIFGVTMEEKGVTKIVSIEFEEALKHVKDN